MGIIVDDHLHSFLYTLCELVNVEEIGDHRFTVTDGATDSWACRVPERHLILPEDPGAI